jgi:hypothetical protein
VEELGTQPRSFRYRERIKGQPAPGIMTAGANIHLRQAQEPVQG